VLNSDSPVLLGLALHESGDYVPQNTYPDVKFLWGGIAVNEAQVLLAFARIQEERLARCHRYAGCKCGPLDSAGDHR
jgi:hypothetical protein